MAPEANFIASTLRSPLGEPPGGWQLVRLADITTKIGSGATPRGGDAVYLTARRRYALVRSQNVFDRWFDSSGLAFISDDDATALRGVDLQQGDVLLNITGDGITFARACVVPTDILPAVVNQHVSIVRVDRERALPGFVLAYLTHPTVKRYIESFNAGGSRRAITKGHIESFVVPLPPLAEQRSIARILDTLDSKIEINREVCETLEAMARALFKSFFVDFDPVRVKMAGRELQGMDADTSALFPSSLQETALGPVPKGWSVEPLDSVAQFLNGLALQKFPADGPDFLPVIKIAQLRRGDTVGSDRASPRVPANYLISDGDLLFSWSGSLTVTIWCGGPGALNQHLFKVTSERFPRWLVHRWLLQHLPEFQAIAADKATTMGHIQRGHLTRALVAVPPPDVLRRLGPVFESLEARWVANKLESRNLRALRDGLLPKLMSGELNVSEVERET